MKMGRTPGQPRPAASDPGRVCIERASVPRAEPPRTAWGTRFRARASVRIARVLKSSAGCLCRVPLGGFFHVLGGVRHAELHGPHTQLFDGESGKRLIPLQVVQRGL